MLYACWWKMSCSVSETANRCFIHSSGHNKDLVSLNFRTHSYHSYQRFQSESKSESVWIKNYKNIVIYLKVPDSIWCFKSIPQFASKFWFWGVIPSYYLQIFQCISHGDVLDTLPTSLYDRKLLISRKGKKQKILYFHVIIPASK